MMGDRRAPIKVAVIGVGHHGRHHARIYSGIEGVRLIGVVDKNFETAVKTAGEYKTNAYANPDDIIGQVDAVSIAVPAVDHLEVAELFLKRRIHIFMEKPIADNPSRAAKLADMVKESGVIFQAGHIERFNPGIKALKSLIVKPQFIEAHRLCRFSGRCSDIGVVMDLMVHDLDIVLHLVNDKIKSISAVGVNVLNTTEDIANARLEFEHGCVANITSSRVSADNMRKIRIFQHDSYISLDYRQQEGLIYRKSGNEIVTETVPVEKSEPLKLQLESFIDCIRTGAAPLVTVEDGKRAVDVAGRILHEIESRKKAQWSAVSSCA
jgi:predicted dehydrogenase